jgi:L-alanine-DL-glutamate epimerase-like enolase superfamily enzyme
MFRLRALLFKVPLARSYVWSVGKHNEKWGILISFSGPAGSGWGEVAFPPDYFPDTQVLFDELSTLLEEWSSAAGAAVVQAVEDNTLQPLKNTFTILERFPRFRCGLSSALFSYTALACGISIVQLLTGEANILSPEVNINGLTSIPAETSDVHSIARIDQQMITYRQKGIRVVKVKCTANIKTDFIFIVRLSEEYPEFLFRLDPNGAWQPNMLAQEWKIFPDLPIEYIEEPFPFNVSLYESFCRLHPEVPLAIDHWGETVADLRGILSKLKVRAVILKAQILGGADKLLEVIEVARQFNTKTIVTGSLETLVGLNIATECAALSAINKGKSDNSVAAGLMLWDYIVPNTHIHPIVNEGRVIRPLVEGKPDLSNLTQVFEASWKIR